MKIVHTLLAATLITTSAFAEQKHRAAKHPSAGVAFQATVKGKVLDAATGNPINVATVTFGEARVTTNSAGEFQIFNTTAYGDAAVTASRSGFNSGTLTVNNSKTEWNLTFHLQSRPTVTLKTTDGTTRTIDDDSIRFGYIPSAFQSYIASESEDFCKPDVTPVLVPISSI